MIAFGLRARWHRVKPLRLRDRRFSSQAASNSVPKPCHVNLDVQILATRFSQEEVCGNPTNLQPGRPPTGLKSHECTDQGMQLADLTSLCMTYHDVSASAGSAYRYVSPRLRCCATIVLCDAGSGDQPTRSRCTAPNVVCKGAWARRR